jgi:hypothetical protein
VGQRTGLKNAGIAFYRKSRESDAHFFVFTHLFVQRRGIRASSGAVGDARRIAVNIFT